MTYILVIYTVIACGPTFCKSDWRPLGEFYQDNWERKYTAKEMCEGAAKELNFKTNEYRCVRNR